MRQAVVPRGAAAHGVRKAARVSALLCGNCVGAFGFSNSAQRPCSLSGSPIQKSIPSGAHTSSRRIVPSDRFDTRPTSSPAMYPHVSG